MNEALLRTAYGMQQAGNIKEAARLYGEILRSNPRNFRALYYLAYLHFQAGSFASAERLFEEAGKIDPAFADVYFARGCALQRLNRQEEALAAFDRTLELEPRNADALVNRGLALLDLAHGEEGLASLDKALAIDPEHVEALCARGAALLELKRPDAALTSLDNALKLAPAHVKARINRGNALQGLGRREEALDEYAKALAVEPNNADALANRAHNLFELKRFEDAAATYEKLLSLDPDRKYARGFWMMAKNQICDWRGLSENRRSIAGLIGQGKRVSYPWAYLGISDSAEEQLQCARIYAQAEYPAARPLWRGERYGHRRLRLAYVSGDFRNHPMPHLMAGIFEHHDRARVETIGISFGADDKSDIRARVAAAFERFIDVQHKTDRDIAAAMREMEIDIAVDLAGFTSQSRMGIFAQRPVPATVSLLGYPGTIGTPHIDYIMADRIVAPPDAHRYFSEKIVSLPNSYWPADSKLRVAERTPTRADMGLPENGFVFCSFNNSFKFSPEMFAIWMRLLNAVEGSVLWLLEDNPIASRNLKREARERGIAPERLIFAPRMKMAEHLARQQLADLFLDTLPCNAHTTASDALWVGLPVVTCPGGAFAARVAASILHAVGLPELVAPSLEEYERLALHLACNADALAAIKATLARNRETHPLFNTARLTRHMEAAYHTIWERVNGGLPPASLAVPEIGR